MEQINFWWEKKESKPNLILAGTKSIYLYLIQPGVGIIVTIKLYYSIASSLLFCVSFSIFPLSFPLILLVSSSFTRLAHFLGSDALMSSELSSSLLLSKI